MSRLEHVMARNLAALRVERGWTQTELAARMTARGFAWSTNRATQVETLRRPLSIIETVGLCSVLGTPLSALLVGDEDVDLKDGSTLPLSRIRQTLSPPTPGGLKERAHSLIAELREKRPDLPNGI